MEQFAISGRLFVERSKHSRIARGGGGSKLVVGRRECESCRMNFSAGFFSGPRDELRPGWRVHSVSMMG